MWTACRPGGHDSEYPLERLGGESIGKMQIWLRFLHWEGEEVPVPQTSHAFAIYYVHTDYENL